ncbi:RHS domain-containing protein [Endozoicomonas sp. SM1973]|uniref:RHS domain-containing protein n=1 Tax=Spartinivicinus marinus TaxID=2994442 RepID=A0A853IGW8_9GAMM|nr:RHS domain-containing protein [Spartinivicinus marinus]
MLSETRENIHKTYLYEPESFRPLALVQDNQVYFYHLDQLGTPQEISDARGSIVWSVQYRAYGSVVRKQVEHIQNNLRFQGQYFDEETGLHYNRHRYYDPGLGRFINQDPIGLDGGDNLYQYTPSPIAWTDPLGLSGKPSLPSRVLLENDKLRVVHNYHDIVREHADPIHFHVEDTKGKTVAKIKANGEILESNKGLSKSLNKSLGELLEPTKAGNTAINKLRNAEKRIAKFIRFNGGKVGGRPFKAGKRGLPSYMRDC